MANKSDHVFVDTSMFKALVDEKDDFHEQADSIWKKLTEENVILITSNYILDETYTLIDTRCGLDLVLQFRESLLASIKTYKMVRVATQDEANAWEWFAKDWSKLSFTDCVSFALMKRLGLTRVATFDDHFKRAGFMVEK